MTFKRKKKRNGTKGKRKKQTNQGKRHFDGDDIHMDLCHVCFCKQAWLSPQGRDNGIFGQSNTFCRFADKRIFELTREWWSRVLNLRI